MEREAFERLAWEAFESLPEGFLARLDNVWIVVEDFPSGKAEEVDRRSGSMLLGLYEGVPVSKRGIWYGSSPVVPDKITLFRKNIERSLRVGETLKDKIRDVLIHEIAHHFGMDEEEIRRAGY